MGCKVKNCVSYSIQLFILIYRIVGCMENWAACALCHNPVFYFACFFVLFYTTYLGVDASSMLAVLLAQLCILYSMRDEMCRHNANTPNAKMKLLKKEHQMLRMCVFRHAKLRWEDKNDPKESVHHLHLFISYAWLCAISFSM